MTLELNDELMRELQKRAAERGLTVEECATEIIEAAFPSEKANPDFRTAADYVLKKNAELLKRLAQGDEKDPQAKYLLNKNQELYRRLA